MTSALSLFQQLARAGFQSGTIMATADVFTQTVIEHRPTVDLWRTGRWTMAGWTLHGPYFYLGFRHLDRYFGAATSLKIVAYKTATAQFVLFPPYLVALFSFFGFWESYGHNNNNNNNSWQAVSDKICQCVPGAFVGGCVFWPFVNVINFGFVPATMRIPYVAASAGVWNSYLSWTNARTTNSVNKSLDIKGE
jgi:protein Mpv17